jgi:superfamily II DNA or RNA helicase
MGMDVPPITDVIIAQPIAKNESMMRQARGRAVRPSPGKHEAHFHYLFDELVFPKSHENEVKKLFKGRYERKTAA